MMADQFYGHWEVKMIGIDIMSGWMALKNQIKSWYFGLFGAMLISSELIRNSKTNKFDG